MSDRIRIALANQPWGYIQPPVTRGGSIPVLLYEIAKRLAADSEVTYFTRGSFRRHVVRDAGIDFEYVPVYLDKALIRMQGKIKLVASTAHKPFWAADVYYKQYGTNIGKSARNAAARSCTSTIIPSSSHMCGGTIPRRGSSCIRIANG